MKTIEVMEMLKLTTNRKEKEEVLFNASPFTQELLKETFDPNLLHHLSLRMSSIKHSGLLHLEDVQNATMELFHFLHENQSSKENKAEAIDLLEALTYEDQEVLLAVINKKLRAGVSIKTLNKVYGDDFIWVEPIQLANKYKEDKKYSTEHWMSSHKLDGMRIFAFWIDGNWKFYTRAKDYLGREVNTLTHWKKDLNEMQRKYGMAYAEGEAYRPGWSFEEIQSAVTSTVNLKPERKHLQFHSFFGGNCHNKLCPKKVDELFFFDLIPQDEYEFFKPIDYVVIPNDKEVIYAELNRAMESGVEGIMLRDPNNKYECKRSNALLKVKKSDVDGTIHTMDATITDMEIDSFVIQEAGKITTEELPVRLHIEYQVGDTVDEGIVGSGFKLHQRREWKKDPDSIINKTVEIEHQGFGANGRLRFPVLKRIREDI